jgi:hypothetical protein
MAPDTAERSLATVRRFMAATGADRRKERRSLLHDDPQVAPRRFACFRALEVSVLPAQRNFCAWFDSRQLHREDARQGR